MKKRCSEVENSRKPLQALVTRSRIIALALILGSSPIVLSGCYGSFPLTKAIYEINGEITDSKVVHSIVTWVFIILPVYSIAMFVDFVALNLVEFWTDEPIEFSQAELEDGTMVTLEPGNGENEAILSIHQDGMLLNRVYFVRQGGGVTEVLNEEGTTTGWVQVLDDGSIQLMDENREVVRVLDEADLADFRATAASEI